MCLCDKKKKYMPKNETINNYINELSLAFENAANPQNAISQKAYMKNNFEFFGIKTPERREIQKPFLETEFLPKKEDSELIIRTLWDKTQREFHYFAMELACKYTKKIQEKDIELFEYLILHNSWWDSIDVIAPKLVSAYFKKFPEKRYSRIENWLKSNNIWLKRSSILFQLHNKKETDFEFLEYVINSLLGTNEFFIDKAIGWILREYGKTNPKKVIDFCETTKLSNLSKKEALRRISD